MVDRIGGRGRITRLDRPVVASVFLAGVLVGCESPINVDSYWGPGVMPSEIGTTFNWAPDTRQGAADEPEYARLNQLITGSVESELTAKGYAKQTTATPDFWVRFGVGRARRAAQGTAIVDFVDEGELAVEIVDPRSGRLMWRGLARAIVNDTDASGDRERRIKEAVQRILERFPSRGEQPKQP
jgi:hypothetical protein